MDGIQKGTITRGIDSSEVGDIEVWCADYHNYGVHTISPIVRFNIGVYQIQQFMIFHRQGIDHQYVSLAEAYLHFLMTFKVTGAVANLPPRIEVEEWKDIDYKNTMWHVGAATRMLVYMNSGTSRRAKFSKEVLGCHLEALMSMTMRAIPRYLRKKCIFDGSENMCANLGKFKP